MRKETDLRQVKATARALLMLDLGETDFSPMIVKHPFTGSGITAISKPAGGIQMLNLMDDPSDLKRWRDFVGQTIEKAGSAYEVYMMVTKPYGLTFLKFVYPHLSQTDMSGILASAWTRAEAPNQDVNVKQSKLTDEGRTFARKGAIAQRAIRGEFASGNCDFASQNHPSSAPSGHFPRRGMRFYYTCLFGWCQCGGFAQSCRISAHSCKVLY